jgi:hypothetical protein
VRPYYHFLNNLNLGLAIGAGLLGLVRHRRLLPDLRGVAWLAIFDALAELVFWFVGTMLHTPNLFMAPIVIVGEVSLTALAYRRALQSAAFNRALPWLLSLFIGYALVESLLRLSATRHLVSLEIIANLLQLVLVGLYFQKLLNELRVERLRTDPFFWLSVALAVYGLGNLFISLFSNYLLTHYSIEVQRIILLGVRNVFNIQLYLAYCLALCLRTPRAQLSGAE